MSSILVTGSTGFIGRYVIEALLAAGHTVIASSGNETHARLQSWFDKVRYIPLDLSTVRADTDYYVFFGKPDKAIHLAWEGLPNYKSDFHLTDNLPRHQLFLHSLVRGGLSDLTVSGTCLEYGMQEGCLSEDQPVRPDNAYAIAKDRLRQYVETLSTQFRLDWKWVRLFYMYGEGQNPKSLFSQLDKALDAGEPAFNMSGGQQVRDFLPVKEVARLLVKIASQQQVTGIINCCSGRAITLQQMVEEYLLSKQRVITLNLGVYPYPDYEPFRFWGDPSKLKIIDR